MSLKKVASLVFSLILTSLLHSWVDIETLQALIGLDRQRLVHAMRTLDHIEKEAEDSWKGYYHILPNMINKFNLKKGCEIGVSTGGHSHKILKTTAVEKLYSIDPYRRNTCLNLGADYYYDVLYYRVKYRLGQFGERSELIRGYSEDVVDRFEDNELDFVFIDGNHLYEYVKQDLILYYNKVRPGGIIAGDDYNTSWPGVPRAVNEFFNALGLSINIDEEESRFWWVQKPNNFLND